MTDQIRIVERYRGVGIHDSQPQARIDGVVKPSIDEVLAQNDAQWLADYAGNVAMPPEARLLAAAKVQALFHLAAEERRVRPDIDLELVQARAAALNSRQWRSPQWYGSLLDVQPIPGGFGSAPRDSDFAAMVEKDRAAIGFRPHGGLTKASARVPLPVRGRQQLNRDNHERSAPGSRSSIPGRVNPAAGPSNRVQRREIGGKNVRLGDG